MSKKEGGKQPKRELQLQENYVVIHLGGGQKGGKRCLACGKEARNILGPEKKNRVLPKGKISAASSQGATVKSQQTILLGEARRTACGKEGGRQSTS